jgi:putative flippase GtrA
MIIIRDPKERTRFLKFVVVGTIGFVVDFLTFNIVRSGIGLGPEISSVISFCVAVLSNFLFNRFWTYPDSRSKPLLGQLMQFAVVNILGLVIRTVIFSLIHNPMVSLFEMIAEDFGIPAIVLGENLSLAIVVIIVMFWNFFINRYWTYNDVDLAES